MSKRLRQIRAVLLVINVLWLVFAGLYIAGQDPKSKLQTKESPEVQARMEEECTGSFRARSDCYDRIAIEVSNKSGLLVFEWIMLVISVPALSIGFFQFAKSREPKKVYASRMRDDIPVVEDDMSWKKAAKKHVTQAKQPDEES